MNSGRPPYSPYGNPQGQQPVGGYPQQSYQPGSPVQGSPYQQPVSGYQQNSPVQQPNPYQQPVSPYQQPNPYQQPVGGYQQTAPYQEHAQQTFQQQAHQPQTWQQQSWQPYGQQQEGGYQPYAQQPPQQTAQYPQYNQQGQPVFPQQGYSGYVSQPARPQKKQGVPVDVIVKAALFGMLPVLFILGLVLGSTALKWVFLAAAVAGIVGMWLTDSISPNLRLTLSLVYGALAVVALVGALNGAAPDTKNPAGSMQTSPGSQQQTQGGYGAASQQGALQWSSTDVPTATPTQTPDPTAADGAAMEQLTSFLYFWSVNNDENMVALTAPSWRMAQEDPAKALFKILANRIPDQDYEIDMSGTDNDTQRTARVKVTIDKNNNRAKERYSFKVIMLKEDGTWYVDPRSLASHDKETATPATVNTTPTQPPQTTGSPNMVLYYNPDGGSYYHLDPNCDEVGKKFRPLKGEFYFSQLNEEPYSSFDACGPCGAPLPD